MITEPEISNDTLKTKTIDVSLLILSPIIWGFGYIPAKIALNSGYSPFFIIGTRSLIASIIFLPFVLKHLTPIPKKTIYVGLRMGVVMALGYVFQFTGLKLTSVQNNAFIIASYVVFIPYIYWIIYKRAPRIIRFIATVISLLGIGVLNNFGSIAYRESLGTLFALIAAFLYALHIILIGRHIHEHNSVLFIFVQLITASIISYIFALIFELPPILHVRGFMSIIHLAILNSVISFLMQCHVQKKFDQVRASLVFSTEALFSTFFSVLILGEKFTVRTVLGGTLVIVAIILAEFKMKPPPAKPSGY